MNMEKLLFIVLLGGFLVACNGTDDKVPAAQALVDGATGVYCGMNITEHPGPKAQVFEKGRTDPLWFTAVRDALAYSRLPGEAQSITALYVHDMGRATSWENPQDDGIWISAEGALYVVGSEKRGGMGMPEVVPFASQAAALDFAEQFGGTVVDYRNIATSYLFPEDDGAVAAREIERTE